MSKKARAMKKQAETDRKRYELEKKEQEARLKFEQEKHEAEMEILKNSDEYKAAEAARLQREAEEKAKQEEEWQKTKAEMNEKKDKFKNWIKTHPIPTIIIIIALLVLIIAGAAGGDSSTTTTTTTTAKETTTEVQLTPEEALSKKMGSDSVVITASDASTGVNGWIDVYYTIGSNLFNDNVLEWYGDSINSYMSDALRGYNQASDYAGYGLTVHFTTSLQDEYGNYSDYECGKFVYNADTLSKINYDNADNLYYKTLSDDYTLADGLDYYVR